MWILGLKDLLQPSVAVPTPEIPSSKMGFACHSQIQPYN